MSFSIMTPSTDTPSAVMTYAKAKQFVARTFGDFVHDKELIDMAGEYIHAAISVWNSRHGFEFLGDTDTISLVSEQSTYQLTKRYSYFISVRISGTNKPLEHRPEYFHDMLHRDPDDPGQPKYWSLWGYGLDGKIMITPPPDSDYASGKSLVIAGHRRIAKPVNDPDTFDLHDDHIHQLLFLAKALMAADRPDTNPHTFAMWRALADESFLVVKSHDQQDPPAQPATFDPHPTGDTRPPGSSIGEQW